MKRYFNILPLLAAVMLFAACGEKKPDVNIERDIFYTVADQPSLAVLGAGGSTVHLITDAEWDALLDRFCDYSQSGEQVMFCSVGRQQSKGNTTTAPTSITTTDRETLKTWMKEMEKAGKTVRITYDNGTWNGTAYANLGQDDMQQTQMYTGTLVFVPAPVLEVPPMGGVAWAMQVSADSTLIITLHGMMMWSDSIDDNMRLIQGATMSLEGVAGQHIDLENNTFMTIGLHVEE